jgi:hypothetical protein
MVKGAQLVLNDSYTAAWREIALFLSKARVKTA